MSMRKIDDLTVEELENEAGVLIKEKVRKQCVEERLYEKYKGVGKK